MQARKLRALTENAFGVFLVAVALISTAIFIWHYKNQKLAEQDQQAPSEIPSEEALLPSETAVEINTDMQPLQERLDKIEKREKQIEAERQRKIREAEEKRRREAEEKRRKEEEAKRKAEEERKRKLAEEKAAAEKAAAELRRKKEEAEKLAAEKLAKEAKEKAEKAAKEAKAKADKAAKEKAEKAAREAREKAAKAEKAAKEAKEKATRAEKEAREKAAKEAKEKAEKEAKAKAAQKKLDATKKPELGLSSYDEKTGGSNSTNGTAAKSNNDDRAALNADLIAFSEAAKNKVWSKWITPANAQHSRNPSLLIKVDNSGRVVSVKVQKSSGNKLYDESVISAVKAASPLRMPQMQKNRERIVSEGIVVNF
ncbi:MAG: cell envelope integrity protein TolA [Cardiobacteriaceae bacterium]|nr:cell envelope integrity protein TolA [Cardiobacteriaceae bacterium]